MNCTPESGGKKKIPFEKNSKGIFFVKLTLKKIRMSKIRFSKEEQAILRTLIAVTKVSDKTLIFTQAFKRKAVLLSRQGKTASQIFKEAGIDIDLFPSKYFHHVIKQWKKSNLQDGIKKGRPPEVGKELDEMSI